MGRHWGEHPRRRKWSIILEFVSYCYGSHQSFISPSRAHGYFLMWEQPVLVTENYSSSFSLKDVLNYGN